MQYRTFGKLGYKVSALGMGCMRLPTISGREWVPDVDYEAAERVMWRAFELGVNFFDTHYGYHGGNSEVALGRALSKVRDKIFIQTKNPFYRPEGPSDTYRSRLETQLERLQTDYIDFYLLHSVTMKTFEEHGEKFLKMAFKAKDEGLIKHIGFSFHDTCENLIKLIDMGWAECVTVQYNLLDRSLEDGIAYAAEKGLGVCVMGPVGGGRLGKPTPEIMSMLPGRASSSAELALRFVLSNPNVSVALSGMGTVEMVEENARTASREEPLSREEKEQLERVLAEKKRLADLYCTGCGYCMPCPNGVDIPGNFALLNWARLYGIWDECRKRYGRMKPEKRAENCQECGVCMDKCPQNIDIIKQLKEVHSALGVEVASG